MLGLAGGHAPCCVPSMAASGHLRPSRRADNDGRSAFGSGKTRRPRAIRQLTFRELPCSQRADHGRIGPLPDSCKSPGSVPFIVCGLVCRRALNWCRRDGDETGQEEFGLARKQRKMALVKLNKRRMSSPKSSAGQRNDDVDCLQKWRRRGSRISGSFPRDNRRVDCPDRDAGEPIGCASRLC